VYPDFVVKVEPVVDHSVRALCAKPYPLHPRGCPNFFSRPTCPPAVPCFDRVFDLSKPVYAVVNEFDIGAHVERMRTSHPEWSDRQLRCVLYWQAGARKLLKAKVAEALRLLPGYKATACPEGMGVNVTETMRRVGVLLEWPPMRFARQIAFLAAPKEE
jgi:hypothetical protein